MGSQPKAMSRKHLREWFQQENGREPTDRELETFIEEKSQKAGKRVDDRAAEARHIKMMVAGGNTRRESGRR